MDIKDADLSYKLQQKFSELLRVIAQIYLILLKLKFFNCALINIKGRLLFTEVLTSITIADF